MVDPINRFPCGVQYGDDITSFQCESIPYCCFNPIDETREVEDDEAVEMLDDPQGTKFFRPTLSGFKISNEETLIIKNLLLNRLFGIIFHYLNSDNIFIDNLMVTFSVCSNRDNRCFRFLNAYIDE